MPSDREKFRHLVAQLRTALEADGDTAFARALSECLRNATGNPQCPMGRLALARHEKGIPARGATPRPTETAARRKELPRFVARGSREEIFKGLLSFLKTQAIMSVDVPLLRALRECQHFVEEESPNMCPLRRLLHPPDGPAPSTPAEQP